MKYSVVLEHLYSSEYYENSQDLNSSIEPVLKDINFYAGRGEVWSIFGSSVFEIRLLLEIMSNAKFYEKGRLLINGSDVTREKRVILPSIFYIAGTNMAYGNMNVLEYLMFITSHSRRNTVSRQEFLLDYLIESDMGYICLTPIKELNPREKSIVLLSAAVLSDNAVLVMNLPRLDYNMQEISAIDKLVSRLKIPGKTLIFSTQCCELAQKVSTHIGYVNKGELIYSNSLESFINEYDRVIYRMGAHNINHVICLLRLALPQFEFRLYENTILVLNYKGSRQADSLLYNAINLLGLNPEYIVQNHKNVKNAIIGLTEEHDL